MKPLPIIKIESSMTLKHSWSKIFWLCLIILCPQWLDWASKCSYIMLRENIDFTFIFFDDRGPVLYIRLTGDYIHLWNGVCICAYVCVCIWYVNCFQGHFQFSHSVMSDSSQPHGPQHTSFPCPSPTPRACSKSCPLSQWCHQTISSSVIPFSSCFQSFPESESFPVSQFFASGGQSIGNSASASVLPVNIQDWFPLGGTGWIFFQSKGHSRVFSNTTVQKHQFFSTQLSHPYMTTGKTTALTRQTFFGKGISLIFNVLSRLVIAFIPRGKCLLISWLQSPSAVILEPPKVKSVTVYIVSHLFAMKWWDWMPWSYYYECWDLSRLFHSPLSLS